MKNPKAYELPYFIKVSCWNCSQENYIPFDAVDFDSHGTFECACDNCEAPLLFVENDEQSITIEGR